MDADLLSRMATIFSAPRYLVEMAVAAAEAEARMRRFVAVATTMMLGPELERFSELDWCSWWVSRKWKARKQRRLDYASNVRRRKRWAEMRRRKAVTAP